MEWKKISDFAEVITGGTPSTSNNEYWENGSIPWLQSGACQNSIITECNTFITEKGLENSAAKMMEKDSVLIALTGATTGKVGYLTFPACANQSVTGIQPNERFVSKYVYYYLKGIRQKILDDSYGGAQKHISQGYVKNIKIPIGSIEEQQVIADMLERIDLIIDARQNELAILDKLIKARFVEMFGDPVINQKGFVVDNLGNYMTTLTDFSANGSYKLLDSNVSMYDEPNYAVMVRAVDFETGKFDITNAKYIDEKAYNLLSKSKLFGNELIMNKIGSAGKIFMMPEIDMPASLGRNAFMFRFNDQINMVFLFHLLNSDYGTDEISQYVRGAVTKTITKDGARAIRIIVPPIELQNEFADFVKEVDKSKVVVQKALDEAQTLFDSLMQQYFG